METMGIYIAAYKARRPKIRRSKM